MIETKALTTTEHLPVKLDAYRTQALHNILVAEGMEEERLTAHLKQVSKSLKALVDEAVKKQRDARHALNSGFEMQEVGIEQKVEGEHLITYRLDTNAVVRERALTADELRKYKASKL